MFKLIKRFNNAPIIMKVDVYENTHVCLCLAFSDLREGLTMQRVTRPMYSYCYFVTSRLGDIYLHYFNVKESEKRGGRNNVTEKTQMGNM
jgi:hypothetical protein